MYDAREHTEVIGAPNGRSIKSEDQSKVGRVGGPFSFDGWARDVVNAIDETK